MKQTATSSRLQFTMAKAPFLGAAFIANFWFFVVGISSPIFMLLFLVGIVSLFFIITRIGRQYRDTVLGGSIGYGSAYVLCLQLIFFASLLASVMYFIYFQFLDQGAFFQGFEQMLTTIKENPELQKGSPYSVEEQMQLIQELQTQTPINLTILLLYQNLLYGAIIFASISALFIKQTKRTI